MRREDLLVTCGLIAAAAGASLVLSASQAGAPSSSILYEGARLIIGDASAPIDEGAFVVQNGRFAAVGRKGEVAPPAGAVRVDLTGKTVMPALINVHVHIGYEGYTSWGPENYKPANVLDHLQREAYYGVGATQSVGSDPTDGSIQFQRDQQAGKFPPASRFFFMPGMAPPNGGPDAILIKGTKALAAVYEISTPQEARSVVRTLAARGLRSVKIWVDDRRGTYPKMRPEVYTAIIDEAHMLGMKVHAHAIALADQKAVVRAGADVLVHTAGAEKVDEEFLALLKEKTPYWTTVLGLGDRSEVCDNDPFIDQTYSAAALAVVRETACAQRPANPAREEILAYNVPKMVAAGARLVLGTDAGVAARHAFGWAEHHEIARWVELGIPPAQALVAATSRPAELLGIGDMGTLRSRKSADFLVLDGNPLENIRNTRRIASVYLRGAKLDRDALAAAWRNRK
jgi:imidazolonepropionase-like amidohydrolase